jgi:hypothetical protein
MTAQGETRVYLPTGVVAHILPVYSSPNEGYPTCIRCSRQPRWGTCWYGTGSMAEREKAAALPLCSTARHVGGAS